MISYVVCGYLYDLLLLVHCMLELVKAARADSNLYIKEDSELKTWCVHVNDGHQIELQTRYVILRVCDLEKMTSSDVDVLFEVRTAFYLGNFQHCITEAQKIRVCEELQ